MKRYTASQARHHFAAVLDAAERGEKVIIERGERRYVLTAEKRSRPRKMPPSRILWMDPALESGQWHWAWTPGRTMTFQRGQRRR